MAVTSILLKVGDASKLAITRDWYVKYLGFRVVEEHPYRNVFLDHGDGAQLALHVGEPAGRPDAVSLYIEVPDIDALYADLSRQGIPFEIPPQERRAWGGRVALLKDPVGHVVKPFQQVGPNPARLGEEAVAAERSGPGTPALDPAASDGVAAAREPALTAPD